MIDSKLLDKCIENMIRDKHVIESCEYVHKDVLYSIKFKKLVRKPKK